MPDFLQELVGMHDITASETTNTYAILPGAVKGDMLTARIQYVNAKQASGSGVWTFTVQVSYDKGGTWATVGTGTAITLTATVQDGEQSLSFIPGTVPASGQTWVWVLATLTGSPVTPTLAYRADLLLASPLS
jgi:hypothetical protein